MRGRLLALGIGGMDVLGVVTVYKGNMSRMYLNVLPMDNKIGSFSYSSMICILYLPYLNIKDFHQIYDMTPWQNGLNWDEETMTDQSLN